MKTIRIGTFETNSSSTHSITVAKCKIGGYNLPITVELNWDGEFGWEWEKWGSTEEKLEYMVRCLICYTINDEEWLERITAIQKRLSELGINFEIPTREQYKNGYVDHEDWYYDEIEDIYNDDNELLAFLLDNDSYIEGGNDNE